MKHLWAARLCAGTLCLALLWTAPGLSIPTAARGEETAAPDVLEDPQATVGTDEGTRADTACYVATATVADLRDLEYKVDKAMQFRGARSAPMFRRRFVIIELPRQPRSPPGSGGLDRDSQS